MRARLVHILMSSTLLMAASLLVSASASAQDSFTSLRTLAMGGAFVGGGTGTGTVFSNPAGMAMAGLYAVETGYLNAPTTGTHAFGFAVADSKTNPSVAGGGSFTYELSDGLLEDESDDLRGYDARMVTAIPLLPETLSLGFTAHYLRHGVNQRTAVDGDGDGELDIERERVRGYTGDVGVMAAPMRQVLIGAAIHNVLEVEGAPLVRELDVGIGGYIQNLHLEAAWRRDLDGDANTFSVGAEYGVGTVPIRVGYRQGLTESISAGAGWRSATGGFDVVFVQELGDTDAQTFGVSASYFM